MSREMNGKGDPLCRLPVKRLIIHNQQLIVHNQRTLQNRVEHCKKNLDFRKTN